MTTELKDFIRKNKALFWYTPEAGLERISDELLIETISNYGTMQDVTELFEIIGIERAANTFRNLLGRKKDNYFPEVYHFFNFVFDRYAPKYTK